MNTVETSEIERYEGNNIRKPQNGTFEQSIILTSVPILIIPLSSPVKGAACGRLSITLGVSVFSSP